MDPNRSEAFARSCRTGTPEPRDAPEASLLPLNHWTGKRSTLHWYWSALARKVGTRPINVAGVLDGMELHPHEGRRPHRLTPTNSPKRPPYECRIDFALMAPPTLGALWINDS